MYSRKRKRTSVHQIDYILRCVAGWRDYANNVEVISDMDDNLIPENDVKEYQKRSYEDLSSEFQRLYPRVVQLIPLMYNRLTLVDKLSHKEAVTKIYNDHRHLSGFSKRNMRRNLPLENSSIPRRIRVARVDCNSEQKSRKLIVLDT
jgi:hypothetical protein